MDLEELKNTIGSGLLSFPVTDFAADGSFSADSYARRIEWMSSFSIAALFAAGGTGELFSLGWEEYRAVVKTAVDVQSCSVPVIAGVGYGTSMAIEMARAAEAEGADAILLLPHYLVSSPQNGQAEHVRKVCEAIDIGVIYYARGQSRLSAEQLEALAGQCPNLIGYKDGFGDLLNLSKIVSRLGDRLVYVGGVPTAEVLAKPYMSAGVTTYSSAVFNFVPEIAIMFYDSVATGNQTLVDDLLKSFFLPFIDLRDRCPGYSVSLVKAGVGLVGHPAGPVRPPLTCPNVDEVDELEGLIQIAKARMAAIVEE
ncbi:5-dehydro-4-deoxyglucarate dehydratase [uncultured Algimonas sp.]|uniref:5-dehydro-4-deoxyglucarate dehydratase n=1 Tax=uncultured Algimonas sp. TaxID=1547920 RepID=UPI00344E321D